MNSVREEDIKYVINRIPYRECENKVFLITGANGFLASYMVDTLMFLNQRFLEMKCTVIALCRNQKKAEKRFKEWLENENFILCIQCVEEPISDSISVDYIIHAASNSASVSARTIPADILRANIIGTYNLLEFARDRKVKSFLFFSSGAVYGNVTQGTDELKETDFFPLNFNTAENCYAEGKRAGEALCKAYFEQYSVPSKIVRIGHTYGPGIDLQDGHVYSDFVSKLIRRENLTVHNGSAVRPFCYVSDAIAAFFKILLEGENGEVYNMVNKEETISVYELAARLVEEAFPERKLKVECKIKNVNTEKVIVNTDKLVGLGWSPQIGVVEGFRRTVNSFEEEIKNGRLVWYN